MALRMHFPAVCCEGPRRGLLGQGYCLCETCPEAREMLQRSILVYF